MPRYTYTCCKCKKTFDAFTVIADRDKPQMCSCGYTAARDFGKELQGLKNVDGVMKENERWSWSMGVHVEQIPEMMKKYPGSEYHPKTGQLKIKNRNHKNREMKRRGFAEYA